jgi:formylglycine-generating enzyme required for sulfatase activity
VKKAVLLTVLFAVYTAVIFAQNAELPKLAVVEFSPNPSNEKTRTDSITVRNLVESHMVGTRKYQIITRDDIDKLLANQRIQVSSISSAENLKKLQLQNISYIVTGSVDAMGDNYAITVRVLDVSNGQFSHSDNALMGSSSRDLYGGINSLMVKFFTGMSVVEVGTIIGIATETRTVQPAVPANFVRVEGGTFFMGSNNGDDDEKPVHSVTVKSFYISKYEVTQKEWREIMGTTLRQQRDMAEKSWPLYGEGDNYPMYYVNWYEAVEYCVKLSLKEGLTPAYRGSGNNITCDWNANGYRLPTEAEWEFAAKGGTKDYLSTEYSGSNSVGAVGWYKDNNGNSTQPVGTKAANSLGIYDMSGNVFEWCWDWYGSYSSGAQTDPRGPASGDYRVLRGGSWFSYGQYLRSACRDGYNPSYWDGSIGFRLVRP